MTGPSKAVSLAVVVLLATAVLGAQQRPAEPGDYPMTAPRSWEVEAQLKHIDQNRAAFVHEFLGEWAAVLDPMQDDVWEEFAPIAMKTPAWQLYGASLVGDFVTMAQVLKGRRGAGQFINELTEPQPNRAPEAFGQASGAEFGETLGSHFDSLVFTPIQPCRMVDTRGAGARTGVLLAGTSRAFDLTTAGYAKGQGGATSGCAGLPLDSHHPAKDF